MELEETMKGKDRTAGVLERIGNLEKEGVIASAKTATVAALISLVVTAAPLLAVVLPAVQKLSVAIEHQNQNQVQQGPVKLK